MADYAAKANVWRRGDLMTSRVAGHRCGRCTRVSLWIKPACQSQDLYRWHPPTPPVGVSFLSLPLVERYLIQNDLWINEPLRGARNPGPRSRRLTASGKACCSHPSGSVIRERLRGTSTYPPRGWAPALAESAAHGWTADDLNSTIDAWAEARKMTPDPKHPIAFIRWLMKEQDLAFSPHVLAQIAAEQAKAGRERQSSQFEAERARYALAATEDSPPAAGQRWQLFRMLRQSAAADRLLSGGLPLTRAQNCARVSAASTTGEKLRIRSSADHDQAGGGVLVEHHQCRSHITGFPLPVELSEPDGALRFAPRQTRRHL